jgi:hypothetical protein
MGLFETKGGEDFLSNIGWREFELNIKEKYNDMDTKFLIYQM